MLLKYDKKINFKELGVDLSAKELRFASELELKDMLNLIPGSVTLLGIMNDYKNKVLLLIDSELKDKKILVHPNVNTKTMAINCKDLINFIDYYKHSYKYL